MKYRIQPEAVQAFCFLLHIILFLLIVSLSKVKHLHDIFLERKFRKSTQIRLT